MPIFPILFLILFTCKITNLIDWSWWLVFLPIIPAILIWLCIAVLFLIIALDSTAHKGGPR